MRIKCIVSYDGYDYMGYQIQDGLNTIEENLTRAISAVCKKDTKIYASGRTDRGVHALGQVIHFDTDKSIDPEGWIRAINAYLPLDIRIKSLEVVDETFHSRFSAKSKEYHYLVETGEYNLFERRYKGFYYNLDKEAMKKALEKLVGTHNFRGFCSESSNEQKDFVKTIYEAYFMEEGTTLRFVFKGTGFLRYQIRRMMGIILEIGRGRESLDTIDRVFETEDSKISRACAEPQGLYLVHVNY